MGYHKCYLLLFIMLITAVRTCTSMLLCGVQQGSGVCGSLSHGGVSQLGITEHWSHSAEKNNCAESLESLNTRPNPDN